MAGGRSAPASSARCVFYGWLLRCRLKVRDGSGRRPPTPRQRGAGRWTSGTIFPCLVSVNPWCYDGRRRVVANRQKRCERCGRVSRRMNPQSVAPRSRRVYRACSITRRKVIPWRYPRSLVTPFFQSPARAPCFRSARQALRCRLAASAHLRRRSRSARPDRWVRPSQRARSPRSSPLAVTVMFSETEPSGARSVRSPAR